jgi:hypothetical protein
MSWQVSRDATALFSLGIQEAAGRAISCKDCMNNKVGLLFNVALASPLNFLCGFARLQTSMRKQ